MEENTKTILIAPRDSVIVLKNRNMNIYYLDLLPFTFRRKFFLVYVQIDCPHNEN